MDERARYEALTEEHGFEGALLVRRDGTQEPVTLQAVKFGGSDMAVRLVVHATNAEDSFQIIADKRKLAGRLLDPVDDRS